MSIFRNPTSKMPRSIGSKPSADEWFTGGEMAQAESRTLAALRDALLPKLISGELRVKDAEKFIGRAV